MIAPLRRLHAALWPVLAALVALLLGVALASRPAWDAPSPWPAEASAADGPAVEGAR
jgi:hypothetical protein